MQGDRISTHRKAIPDGDGSLLIIFRFVEYWRVLSSQRDTELDVPYYLTTDDG